MWIILQKNRWSLKRGENFQRILDEQVLANAIFYSFAVGRLKHADDEEYEAIEDLRYVQSWIEDKQDLLLGFKVE